MNPTQLLNDEHRVIEQVLDCLERMAEECRAEDRLALAEQFGIERKATAELQHG